MSHVRARSSPANKDRKKLPRDEAIVSRSGPNCRRDGAIVRRLLNPLGFAVGKRFSCGGRKRFDPHFIDIGIIHASPLITMSMNVAAEYSRRSLSLTVLRWSRERVHNTKSIINDMLRWPELYAFEAPHLQAALEALEKAEVELNFLN